MLLKAVLVLGVMSYVVSPYPLMTDKAVLNDTWPELEELFPNYKAKTPTNPSLNTSCSPLTLPQFQQIRSSDVHKLVFKPEGKSRPVSDLMKSILLPSPLPEPETPLPSKPRNIELLCYIDRIFVRVRKSLFTTRDAGKYLKVGTCSVNKVTAEHYYFLHWINSCNVQRHVRISNWLSLWVRGKKPFAFLCGCAIIKFLCLYRKMKTVSCIQTC